MRIINLAEFSILDVSPPTEVFISLNHTKVIADGTWDARGTLAVDRDAPVGLTEVKLRFEIDITADRIKLDKMINLTVRHCLIYPTLAKPPTLTSELKIIQKT